MKYNYLKLQRGFTLIETIISIVILAIAMLMLSSALFPQVSLSSQAHYQARASALANAMMNEILARKFDRNSDDNGERRRCGDNQDLLGKTLLNNHCSINVEPQRETHQFVAVDDYIGCWQGKNAQCENNNGLPLSSAIGEIIADDYAHFTVTVDVFYDDNLNNIKDNNLDVASDTSIRNYKRINMMVDTGRYGHYQFSAYRGNY